MKWITLLFIMLLPILSVCQELDECYIDAKTGDTISFTKWGRLTHGSDYLTNFRLYRLNDRYSINLRCHFGKRDQYQFNAGDSLWIKFDNGQTVRLYTDSAAVSKKGNAKKSGATLGAVTQGIRLSCSLAQFQLLTMASNTPEKIRYFTPWGPFDMKILVNPCGDMSLSARSILLRPKKIEVLQQKEAKEKDQKKEESLSDW